MARAGCLKGKTVWFAESSVVQLASQPGGPACLPFNAPAGARARRRGGRKPGQASSGHVGWAGVGQAQVRVCTLRGPPGTGWRAGGLRSRRPAGAALALLTSARCRQ